MKIQIAQDYNLIIKKWINSFNEELIYNVIISLIYQIYVRLLIMKKVKSPVKHSSILLATQKTAKNDQLMSNYKQVPNLRRTHEQEHKRNANSIKKVLKELQQFKKQLKEIKTIKRLESIPQQLDNSKCRKINAQTKRSSPSQQYASHSSSKNKTFSAHKQTSTQTKRLNRNINQFSFSIHDKSSKSPFDNKYQDSEEEDSNENPFSSKKFILSDQRGIIHENSRSRQNLKASNKDKIQSIQASQKYEKYLNLLKNSFEILPISSRFFSSEQKLKLSIEIQRLSTQIRRIPIYIQNPDQYYQLAVMYARGLNNQLNNLAIVLNRCDGKKQDLKEKLNYENIRNKEHVCSNCEQNQKKDIQRQYKRQAKRFEKQIHKIQKKLQKANQEITILTTQNLILIKQKDQLNEKQKRTHKNLQEQQEKISLLKRQIQDLQQVIQDSNSIRVKQIQKNKIQEEDLNYYKCEIQKLKKNAYSFREQRNHRQKVNQQQLMIAQLKGKQQLYQQIIKDKQSLISQLKKQVLMLQGEFSPSRFNKKKRKEEKQQNQSQDSQEFYQLKLAAQEKDKIISRKNQEILAIKQKNINLEKTNKEMVHSLQKCTNQITKLHFQINSLEEANEKFKDKYLKSKVKNENKIKKDVQLKNRKGKAFQEINDLIKHHKDAIENDLNDE